MAFVVGAGTCSTSISFGGGIALKLPNAGCPVLVVVCVGCFDFNVSTYSDVLIESKECSSPSSSHCSVMCCSVNYLGLHIGPGSEVTHLLYYHLIIPTASGQS